MMWGQLIGSAIGTAGQIITGQQALKGQREQHRYLNNIFDDNDMQEVTVLAIMAIIILLLIFLIFKKQA